MQQLRGLVKKKGFTLVELVMVMVIIGLLSAIIIPRFAEQRKQAMAATTRANLESLRTAVGLFQAKQGVFPNELDLVMAYNYLLEIPKDGFLSRTDTIEGAAYPCTGPCAGGTGGWCYDENSGGIYPNLPDTLEPDGGTFCNY